VVDFQQRSGVADIVGENNIHQIGFETATPAEAREILGLLPWRTGGRSRNPTGLFEKTRFILCPLSFNRSAWGGFEIASNND
jgi:hypothetical protein